MSLSECPTRPRSRRPLAVALVALLGGVVGCASLPSKESARTEVWGFTAPWDPRSTSSLVTHRAQLDVVVSGWIALDSATFQPVALFPDTFVTHNSGQPRAMALVTSYQGTRFHPETVRGASADSGTLGKEAGSIAAMVVSAGYHGIVLDLEGMTPGDLPTLLAFTKAVTDSAHAHGITPVGLAVPVLDTLGYPAAPLLREVDFLTLMLYDQHWLTSPPGPIAAPDWVQRMLQLRTHDVDPTKLVAAFPVYGYQWRPDSATAVLSYSDAQQLATQAHISLERDTSSATLYAKSGQWELWSSDAMLLDTLVHEARNVGITRIALWRLGLEDPRVWTQVIR